MVQMLLTRLRPSDYTTKYTYPSGFDLVPHRVVPGGVLVYPVLGASAVCQVDAMAFLPGGVTFLGN